MQIHEETVKKLQEDIKKYETKYNKLLADNKKQEGQERTQYSKVASGYEDTMKTYDLDMYAGKAQNEKAQKEYDESFTDL